MGARILALIGAAFVSLLLALYLPLANAQTKADAITEAKPAPPVPWSKVPASERRVLSALEKDWSQLPASQQRRLIGAAKKYPTLAPIQQQRFQERLKEWSALTPEQRHVARDKYQNLSSLPPAKQDELREKWQEKSERSKDVAPVPLVEPSK